MNSQKLLLFIKKINPQITNPPKKKKNKRKYKRKNKEIEDNKSSSSSKKNLQETKQKLAEDTTDAIDETLNDQPDNTPLKYNSAREYINAIINLYNQQIALKLHEYPNPRGFGVRGHLKNLQASTHARVRAHHKDRAIGTILDSYTPEIMRNFIEKCWERTKYTKPYLRTIVDFLIGHYFLLRDQLRRTAEFTDIFILDFPSERAQNYRY